MKVLVFISSTLTLHEGFEGEEVLEEMMMKYPELSKKYRGNCDEDCLREKTRFATEISRVERKTESAMDEAIQQVEEKSSKLRELNDKIMEVGEIWSKFVKEKSIYHPSPSF